MTRETALRYDRMIERTGTLGHSHRWLIARVPEGATVLDCGCAGGYLARALREVRGCTVDGVELDPEAADRATTVCRRVFVGSLDDATFLSGLAGTYDRVIFGDVLEHLEDPAQVLTLLRGRIAAAGRILASIPNVAHWRVRWNLLRGRFEYQDSGLLDRTHLRFYTYEGARRLIENAGYDVVAQDFTYVPFPLRIVRPIAAHLLRGFPNLMAYQTMLEATPCPA